MGDRQQRGAPLPGGYRDERDDGGRDDRDWRRSDTRDDYWDRADAGYAKRGRHEEAAPPPPPALTMEDLQRALTSNRNDLLNDLRSEMGTLRGEVAQQLAQHQQTNQQQLHGSMFRFF